MGVENIYSDAGFAEVHHIEQALRARAVYHRDKDYVVKRQRKSLLLMNLPDDSCREEDIPMDSIKRSKPRKSRNSS